MGVYRETCGLLQSSREREFKWEEYENWELKIKALTERIKVGSQVSGCLLEMGKKLV